MALFLSAERNLSRLSWGRASMNHRNFEFVPACSASPTICQRGTASDQARRALEAESFPFSSLSSSASLKTFRCEKSFRFLGGESEQTE